MRVLLIDVNCRQSSTGKIVYDLYRRLRADGHEAAICYGRGEVVEGEGIFKFGLDWETAVHAGLARLTGRNGCFSPFSTKRLLAFIEAFRPDVVHIHELHAYFVNHTPLLTYLRRKNIKVVWTFHCEYMYTGKCGHAHECENWKHECGRCPALREYPKSLFLDGTRHMLREKKKLLENWDFHIVTPSQWLAQRVRQSFLKGKAISVIHNGIDTETVFHPQSREAIDALKQRYGLDGKRVVLSVAPNIMSEDKGGGRVVEVSRHFGDEVHFVLVGADANDTVGSHVTLLQRTANQQELALWYSAADVFLICSKRENFPTTCLEALCCGTVVIGIDAGGTRETAPAPYGVFAQPEDTHQLVTLINRQLKHGYDKQAVSRFGREAYDNRVMYAQYLRLYEEAQQSK